MSRHSDHPRTFKGFVALEREGGPIIWGTLRPDAADCRATFEKWNPGLVPVIRRVRLSLEVAQDHIP